MAQYRINDSTNYLNIMDSPNNVWNNRTFADDRSPLLTWLSPLEPELRHRDIQDRRVDNVGRWLMQIEEFRSWYDGSGKGEGGNSVLFYYGDLGVGKTFVSSLVVDRLYDQTRGQNTAVTCFYFDFVAHKEQSAASMLGSLVKQIVCGMERIPEEISRVFEEQKSAIGGQRPQLPDIVKMLLTITSSRPTFICIDALDECAGVHRVKLLDSLNQILEKSPGTRVFLTGRPHIRNEVENGLPGRVVSVSVGPRKDDIIWYLHAKLDGDKSPDAMDESLEVDILKKLLENRSEMFVLTSLNIDAILQESTIHRRREKLGHIRDGLVLGDAYSATIERIKAQYGDKSRLGMAALMWISYAERPLKVDELCHALAVELGSTNFNASNAPSLSTLVSCCQGLVTVDKEASSVRLIHFTLQKYLSAHSDIFGRPHSAMAEICLTYLNSQQVKALQNNHYPDTQVTPFLEYCSVYWGVHTKKECSDHARSLALELFQEHYGHLSTRLLLAREERLSLPDIDSCSPFSGLLCASFFGVSEIAAALIDVGCCDINEADSWGNTPLAWAAYNGHEEVVKILLGQEGVRPDTPGSEGRTPLSLAVASGHEEVVNLLLWRGDVDPNKRDGWGRIPLIYAALRGYERLVKIILGREGVNPDVPGDFARTPLMLTAMNGHVEVVKILLGREDVNPSRSDILGQTPLLFAAMMGHEEVVKIILAREEVDPNKPDIRGQSPLSHAARHGHAEVVKILLGHGKVNPNNSDDWDQTPLSLASTNGHKKVVKLLLEREDANLNKPDTFGQRAPARRCPWNSSFVIEGNPTR